MERASDSNAPRLKSAARRAAAILFGLAVVLVGSETSAARGDSDALVAVGHPVFALEHLVVVDGTGAPARRDQTIIVSMGRIVAVGEAGQVAIPAGAVRYDLTGKSAIPGLVGMHDHLFFAGDLYHQSFVLAHDMPLSYPRLYLAAGVTFVRTTGAFEPYTDLEIKRAIDAGELIGPKMNVTTPYLDGPGMGLVQIHQLTGPADARRTIDYWASEGAGSVKVYQNITRAELKASVAASHAHGLKITGHFCSIGLLEAAKMGVDGVEHGLFVDTDFAKGREPDHCLSPSYAQAADLAVEGPEIQGLIRSLVTRKVAVTSTLPIWEEVLAPSEVVLGPGAMPFPRTRPPIRPEVLEALSPQIAADCQQGRAADVRTLQENPAGPADVVDRRYAEMLEKEMAFEREFVRAGGLLLAGADGVTCGDIAGFGDERQLELLVQAGFTIPEAIRIGSFNGARFLGLNQRLGALRPGLDADIVILDGDISRDIAVIRSVETVFKDGIGYDARHLRASVRGLVGLR